MTAGRANILPRFFLIVRVFLIIVILSENVKSDGIFGYGPYNTTLEQFEAYNGPKGDYALNLNMNLTIHVKNGHAFLQGIATAKWNVLASMQVRVRIWKWTGKRFELSLTQNIPDICEFRNVSNVLSQRVTLIDSKTCFITKGVTIVDNVDLNILTKNFLGDRFFYGRFKSRTTFFTTTKKIARLTAIGNIIDTKYLDIELKRYKVYISNNPMLIPTTIVSD